MGRKNVEIRVRAKQTFADGTFRTYEQKSEGVWYLKGNAQYLLYPEDDASGLGKTQTTLKIAQDGITLIRQGEIRMHHVFRQTGRFPGTYSTPYGNFTFWVEMERMEHTMEQFPGEREGKIRIDYRMEMEGEKSRMNLQIEVKNTEKE
jgi:uncharacterized beta-barrel protein YwiB (DUF1934 family)